MIKRTCTNELVSFIGYQMAYFNTDDYTITFINQSNQFEYFYIRLNKFKCGIDMRASYSEKENNDKICVEYIKLEVKMDNGEWEEVSLYEWNVRYFWMNIVEKCIINEK